MKDWNIIADRIQICVMLPFLYPWRLFQSVTGWPVDMGEFHRQIADVWRGTALYKGDIDE